MQVFIERTCPSFWDSFVKKNSPLLFHRFVWAKVLKDGYAQEPLYCWLEKDGEPVLALLGGVSNFRIVRILFATFHYGGLVGNLSELRDFCRLLDPQLKQMGIHEIRLLETKSLSVLEEFGYRGVDVPRHIVDIGNHSLESLFNEFKRSVRKNIRKSQKEGVTVDEVVNRETVDNVFQLYLDTMSYNKAAAKYPKERFF